MDNEQDYIELHRLLAKCKWNIFAERAKLNWDNREQDCIEYLSKKLKQIDEFIVDIPIFLIKGDEI